MRAGSYQATTPALDEQASPGLKWGDPLFTAANRLGCDSRPSHEALTVPTWEPRVGLGEVEEWACDVSVQLSR